MKQRVKSDRMANSFKWQKMEGKKCLLNILTVEISVKRNASVLVREHCHSVGIFFQTSTVLDNKKDASSMTDNSPPI
jgi:hypothetical protein